MNRYEFEVMCFFAENPGKSFRVRDLGDELKISGNMVTDTIEALEDKGWIQKCGDNVCFALTEEGFSALSPYKVNKAVVLAAGFGSRMMPATKDCPKPMVKVGEKRIIETLLDALEAAEVKDITVVGGYKWESLKELLKKYSFLNIVENDRYETENNISSIMRVLDSLSGRLYICEADLYVSNPRIIKKYMYSDNILSSFALETDDWCFDMENGCIKNYRKGGKYCYNYYGISCWTPETVEALKSDYIRDYQREGGKDLFWEFVPLIEEADRYHVEIRLCQKQDIMEIDNYYELQQLNEK